MAPKKNDYDLLTKALEKGDMGLFQEAWSSFDTPPNLNEINLGSPDDPAPTARPLEIAAGSGNLEMVEELIRKGADINGVNERNGFTPLHTAIQSGNKELVNKLLDMGANVNAEDKTVSPLHLAVSSGDIDLATRLINSGAKLEAQTPSGSTALHWSKDIKMTQFLVGKGANVNAVDESGYTPLSNAALAGDTESIKFLIGQGADMEKAISVMLTMPGTKTYDSIKSFVKEGGQKAQDILDKKLESILSKFDERKNSGEKDLEKDDKILLESLIKSGANIDKVLAKVSGEYFPENKIDLLISKGADATQALVIVAKDGDEKATTNLLKKGNITKALDLAAVDKDKDKILTTFVNSGIDPNAQSSLGTPILHLALTSDNLGLTQTLLDKGANPNSLNKEGISALSIACSKGNVELAHRLVTHGSEEPSIQFHASGNLRANPTAQTLENSEAKKTYLTGYIVAKCESGQDKEFVEKHVAQVLQIGLNNVIPGNTPDDQKRRETVAQKQAKVLVDKIEKEVISKEQPTSLLARAANCVSEALESLGETIAKKIDSLELTGEAKVRNQVRSMLEGFKEKQKSHMN